MVVAWARGSEQVEVADILTTYRFYMVVAYARVSAHVVGACSRNASGREMHGDIGRFKEM